MKPVLQVNSKMMCTFYGSGRNFTEKFYTVETYPKEANLEQSLESFFVSQKVVWNSYQSITKCDDSQRTHVLPIWYPWLTHFRPFR